MIWFIISLGTLGMMHKYLGLPRFLVDIQRRIYGQIALRGWMTVSEEYDTRVPIDTPIVIANHSSHIDILYFGIMLETTLAYVAKKSVS